MTDAMPPALSLNTRIWPALGTRPPLGEEQYVAGEQPIAAYDNWWNWALSKDIENLNDTLGDHDHRHEVGGQDELNLQNLKVNTVLALNGDPSTDEYRWVRPSDSLSVARIDMADEEIKQWPAFATQIDAGQGVSVSDDITRSGGGVLYDFDADKFHWAVEADHAATADWADQAGELVDDGGTVFEPGDFLTADQDATITGTWTFTNLIDGDISGNAATADHADTADSATNATHAQTAGDSDTVDGYHAQDLIDDARAGLSGGHSVSQDGTQVVDDPDDVNFGQGVTASADGDGSVTVSAGTNSEPVEHAEYADYAFNSDKVDNYHAEEIIQEAINRSPEGRWSLIDIDIDVDTSTSLSFNWSGSSSNSYDRYRLAIYHESHASVDISTRLRLNGDYRERYITKYVESGADIDYDSTGNNVFDETTNHWSKIGGCSPGRIATEEIELTLPERVSSPDKHFPTMSTVSTATSARTTASALYGELESDYDNITDIELDGTGNGTGKVALYGQNIPTSL